MTESPKTIEQARALRESDGMLTNTPPAPLGGGMTGDTICAFVDTDGVAKKVENVGGEWVRVPM